MFNQEELLLMLLSIPGIIFAFSFKGFSQAFVAKKLGDDTPERNGQLSLNPMAHIDIIGFICILLLHIGWGKPVVTNSRNYKNIKRDSAIQILSGPVGLVVGGVILSFFFVLTQYLNFLYFQNKVVSYIATILLLGMNVCLTLANFHLLPLPGLDGYNFIANFLPYQTYRKLYAIEKYSTFIFLGFILLMNYTVLGEYIFLPADFLSEKLLALWNLVFNAIFF